MKNLRQKFVLILAGALVATEVWAQAFTYETIPALDGVPLVVAGAGKTDGPAILFIHGYAQGLLAWKKQLGNPHLAAKYRMVALDLRGHGASGKPWTEDRYEDRDWADDIARVIEAKSLCKPVLAGWSFGGSVMAAYVRHYGESDISGLVLLPERCPSPPPSRVPAWTMTISHLNWLRLWNGVAKCCRRIRQTILTGPPPLLIA